MRPEERLAIHGGPKAVAEPLPSGAVVRSLIDEEEVQAVAEVIRSGKLFRYSDHKNSQCTRFEQEACALIGVSYGLLVNSGTNALISGLIGLGVGPGDEVIVPAYTYIATAAAVVAVGAVPVIAEIDESLGLDPEDVRRKITPHTRCIIPVHMQGVPCRLNAILEIANGYRLLVLEDCCQSIGARYFGRMTGSFGHAGAWSLNYYKVITCGEGGFVFTNDYRVFERIAYSADPGLPMWMREYAPDEVPTTEEPFSSLCLRGNEILAAMLRVQLRKMEPALGRTRAVKKALREHLNSPRHYVLQHQDDPEGDCGISIALIVESPEAAKRFAEALTAEGVPTGTAHNEGFPDRHIYRYWDSILQKRAAHPGLNPWRHPMYAGKVEYDPEMCPQTLDILSRTLRIGLNVHMSEDHGRQIARAINKVDAAL